MKTHIIENGKIVNTILATVAEAQSAFPASICIAATEGSIGWSYADGVFTPPVIPPLTPEEIAAETTIAIQAMLDAKANEYEYDNIHTACGWASDFPDALALQSWGAACWLKSKQIRDEVLAGTRPMPTMLEVLAEMPVFIAP